MKRKGMSTRARIIMVIITALLALASVGCDGKDYNLSNNMNAATENLETLNETIDNSPIGE